MTLMKWPWIEKSLEFSEPGAKVGRDFFRTNQHLRQVQRMRLAPAEGTRQISKREMTARQWRWSRQEQTTRSRGRAKYSKRSDSRSRDMEKNRVRRIKWGRLFWLQETCFFSSISVPRRLSIKTAVTQQLLKIWNKGKHSHAKSALEIGAEETQKYRGQDGSQSRSFLWNKMLSVGGLWEPRSSSSTTVVSPEDPWSGWRWGNRCKPPPGARASHASVLVSGTMAIIK